MCVFVDLSNAFVVNVRKLCVCCCVCVLFVVWLFMMQLVIMKRGVSVCVRVWWSVIRYWQCPINMWCMLRLCVIYVWLFMMCCLCLCFLVYDTICSSDMLCISMYAWLLICHVLSLMPQILLWFMLCLSCMYDCELWIVRLFVFVLCMVVYGVVCSYDMFCISMCACLLICQLSLLMPM